MSLINHTIIEWNCQFQITVRTGDQFMKNILEKRQKDWPLSSSGLSKWRHLQKAPSHFHIDRVVD